METFSLAFDQRKLKSNREGGGNRKFNFFVLCAEICSLRQDIKFKPTLYIIQNQRKVLLSLTVWSLTGSHVFNMSIMINITTIMMNMNTSMGISWSYNRMQGNHDEACCEELSFLTFNGKVTIVANMMILSFLLLLMVYFFTSC